MAEFAVAVLFCVFGFLSGGIVVLSLGWQVLIALWGTIASALGI